MSTNTKVDTIIDGLRNRILADEFGEMGKLPSFRKLVKEYETSQETMNKAIQALQAEGFLISSGAKGVFINNLRLRMPGIVIDFSQYLRNQGLNPKSEFIHTPQVIEPPKEVKKQMGLKKDQLVLRRERRQGTDKSLFRIATEYYPMEFITPQILEEINKDPHFSIIIAIKKNFGKTIQYAHEDIIARLPTGFEQEQLQIVRTNPVIESNSCNFAGDKKTPLLYYHKVLNANHFVLSHEYTMNYWG